MHLTSRPQISGGASGPIPPRRALCQNLYDALSGYHLSTSSARQCQEAVLKANRILGMVHRQFRDMDRKSFLIIYKGFIRPHLEYAIQTWSPYQKGDIEHLEKVQRRATRLVKGYRKLSYEERLRKLGLTTLQTRRLRGDLSKHSKLSPARNKLTVKHSSR